MNEQEIKIIRALQNEEVYLTLDPFGEVAKNLDMEKSKLLEEVSKLKEKGAIRRFGAAMTPHKAGFTSNAMVAWEVDVEREEEAAEIMAEHQRVSHCYLRPPFEDFPYTLYTMTHANSPEELDEILEELSEKAGVEKRRVLKSVKEFKKSSPVYFP